MLKNHCFNRQLGRPREINAVRLVLHCLTSTNLPKTNASSTSLIVRNGDRKNYTLYFSLYCRIFATENYASWGILDVWDWQKQLWSLSLVLFWSDGTQWCGALEVRTPNHGLRLSRQFPQGWQCDCSWDSGLHPRKVLHLRGKITKCITKMRVYVFCLVQQFSKRKEF